MLNHTIFVLHGSIPGQYIVNDEDRFHVYHQVWERAALLNTSIEASFDTEQEALDYLRKIKPEPYETVIDPDDNDEDTFNEEEE